MINEIIYVFVALTVSISALPVTHPDAHLHPTSEINTADISIASKSRDTHTMVQSDSDLTVCSRDSPMCEVTDPRDVGLSGYGSRCSTCTFATPLATGSAGNALFTGGSGCRGGRSICTCNIFGNNVIRRENVARADPGVCATACQAEQECEFAFYRRNSGECYLMRSCTSLVTTWVGNNANSQGGVLYRKWQRPLAVDPGESNWPVEWFGNYTQTPWTEASMPVDATAPAWNTAGTNPGYDWSLPPTVTQSKSGSPIIFRTFSSLNLDWEMRKVERLTDYRAGDRRITPTICFWVKWRDVEPERGQYDFASLITAINTAASRGWRVAIRLLTQRRDAFAPVWTRTLGIPIRYTRTDSYEPEDPTFHDLYLRLVAALGSTGVCANPNVVSMYAGYASSSHGDEHIGPPGADGYDVDTPIVRARLDAWAQACRGSAHKMVMGGGSRYGFSLGFGYRNGFVENYYYQIPKALLGQVWTPEQEYVTVNESVPLLANRAVNGDENEEYELGWNSDFRSCIRKAPGDKANDPCTTDAECVAMQAANPSDSRIQATCQAVGSNSRFGPLASFSYRYFMSMIRSVQMHLTYSLMNEFALVPELAMWQVMSLGRIASESADAFSFLMQAEFHRGHMKNLERWLYQRDTAEIVTIKEAKVTQTPAPPCRARQWMTSEKYDWIARAAPGGIIGFSIDRGFAGTGTSMGNVVIKVTYFDYAGVGTLGVSTDGCRTTIGTRQPTSEDRTLKTATFAVETLPLSETEALTDFDFEVCGFDANGSPQEIIVSFVRVVKANPPETERITIPEEGDNDDVEDLV